MSRNVTLAATLALALVACSSGPPELEAGTFGWESYANGAVGFTMEIPDVYEPEEEGSGNAVLFRWKRGVPVKAYWTTAEEAAHRGLWFGESPVGTATLDGVEGRRYEYRHCDGPFCSRMVSFVIPWRGRVLGLEFRSDGPLNATNRRILESFELDRAGT